MQQMNKCQNAAVLQPAALEIVCTHNAFSGKRVDTLLKRAAEILQLFISINVERSTEKTCDQ